MANNYTTQAGSPTVVTVLVNPSGFAINKVQLISEYVDNFTPTSRQTQFILRHIPLRPTETLLFVNGQQQSFGAQYYINGINLVWTGAFTLGPTDSLSFYYS